MSEPSIPRTTTAERRRRQDATTRPIPHETLEQLGAEWRERQRASEAEASP